MFEDFIASLDSVKDRQQFLSILNKLIPIIEESENRYTEIKNLLENIEVSPLWIIDKDNQIFAQNKKSIAINNILQLIDLSKEESELEFNNCFYLIKIKKNEDKLIITALDMTKSKQEDRLISMGKMASHLAHEIRNPIGSISLLASTLSSQVNAQQQEIVSTMQKAIWRVERIIQATLLFGKDVPSLEFDQISMDNIELGTKECMNYYSYEKDINLDIQIPKDLKIKVHFELILIVIQNMIFNAIDAIEELEDDDIKGIIEVRYYEDEINHIFGFYDNGVKIENKKILFEAYKSTKTKGNGLGLVLSQKIIKAHFGNIMLSANKKEFLIYIKKDI